METAVRRKNRAMSKGHLYFNRRHSRVDVNGFIGDIADGNLVLGGTVENVSFSGFKMSNLPKNFSAAHRSYTMVISGNDKHYRCIVIPCWTKKTKTDSSVEVGFKIIQASWEWTELVLNAVSPHAVEEDFAFQA
jgi:hypothetical protein